MRGSNDLDQCMFAARAHALHVAGQQRLERLLVLPLRVHRRQLLHAVHRKQELEVQGLLSPERAVVIERRNAFVERHEIGRLPVRDFRNEVDDGLLRLACTPRRQRVRCLREPGREH